MANPISDEVDQILSLDENKSESDHSEENSNQEVISFEEALQNGIVPADLREEEKKKSEKQKAA
jgi:hypothetical protein